MHRRSRRRFPSCGLGSSASVEESRPRLFPYETKKRQQDGDEKPPLPSKRAEVLPVLVVASRDGVVESVFELRGEAADICAEAINRTLRRYPILDAVVLVE